jgi:hypothetical protein
MGSLAFATTYEQPFPFLILVTNVAPNYLWHSVFTRNVTSYRKTKIWIDGRATGSVTLVLAQQRQQTTAGQPIWINRGRRTRAASLQSAPASRCSGFRLSVKSHFKTTVSSVTGSEESGLDHHVAGHVGFSHVPTTVQLTQLSPAVSVSKWDWLLPCCKEWDSPLISHCV